MGNVCPNNCQYDCCDLNYICTTNYSNYFYYKNTNKFR